MGREIKNMCTLCPNPYHPKADSNYYYFSVFITPKLQLDGTLKEYFEMLNWLDYSVLLDKHAKICFKQRDKDGQVFPVACEPDNTLLENIPVDKAKSVWEKIFPPDTPVEAWPITINPQDLDTDSTAISGFSKQLNDISESLKILTDQKSKIIEKNNQQQITTGQTAAGVQTRFSTIIVSPPSPELDKINSEIDEHRQKKGEVSASLEAEKKKSRDRYHEMKRFRQEFHKKVSALARYPHMLRLFGLIRDYKVLKKNVPAGLLPACAARFHLNVSEMAIGLGKEHKLTEFVKSESFLFPYTACHFDTTSMFATPAADNKLDDYKLIVRDGFVLPVKPGLTGGAFEVDQEYFEDKSADFQFNNIHGTAVGFNGKTFPEQDLELLKQVVDNSKSASKGLSIKIGSQKTELLTTMSEELGRMDEGTMLSGAEIFFAHHLDCGYRVDVISVTPDQKKGVLSSLCRRSADYVVNGLDNDEPLIPNFLDEPWLEETRQVYDEHDQKRFQEISRWNNWSLTCPAYKADNKDHSGIYNDMELRNVLPVSLIKLRFGNTYRFRIRVVDICGNGVQLDDQNEVDLSTSAYVSPPITYERREKLQPPLFFPPYKIFDEERNQIDARHKGEDSTTLVIRSSVDDDGHIDQKEQSCFRSLTPAHVAVNFAEVSKTTDQYTEKLSELFKLLHQYPSPYYAENELSKEIPFLYDTAVKKFTVKAAGKKIPEIAFQKKAAILRLSILPKDNTPGCFYLKPGQCMKCNIQSEGLYDSGAEKEFLLIHAVQRPVMLGSRTGILNSQIKLGRFMHFDRSVSPPDFSPESTYMVRLQDGSDTKSFQFPVLTTGEFILHVEYQEYKLNKLSPAGWSYVAKDYQGENGLYEDKDEDKADKFYIRKSFNNLVAKTDNFEVLCQSEKDFANFKGNVSAAFEHSFPRTGYYRNVTYRLEAISKYVHFFDEKHHLLSANQVKGNKESQFSIFGTFEKSKIRNAAKPSKPLINSIIPLFSISKINDATTEFQHFGFRIYLGPIWYETGLEEQLAVIYRQKNYATEYNNNTITIIGTDPTATTDKISIVNPKVSLSGKDNKFFTNHQDTALLPKHERFVDSLQFHRLQMDDDSGAGTISPKDYTFSHFDISWNKSAGQFYADVQLQNSEALPYSALITLAVCRYQANSLVSENKYDFRFSDIVKTPMVSWRPPRRITVTEDSLSFDLMGKPGKRIFVKNESIASNFNQCYVVVEFGKKINDDVADIKEKCVAHEIKPNGIIVRNSKQFSFSNDAKDASVFF